MAYAEELLNTSAFSPDGIPIHWMVDQNVTKRPRPIMSSET